MSARTRSGVRRTPLLVLAVVALALLALPAHVAEAGPGEGRWFTSWTMPSHETGSDDVGERTLRMITHLSAGGSAVQVRFDNRFGSAPLEVEAASVAVRSDGPAVHGETLRPLSFAGAVGATIPRGGNIISDPVALVTEAGTDLAVTIQVRGSVQPSQHHNAFHTNYLTEADGADHTADVDGAPFTRQTRSQMIVSAVDVRSTSLAGTIVAVGGSVVDGHGSNDFHGTAVAIVDLGPDRDARWTDVLARRIQDELHPRKYAVANAGVGGRAASEACNIFGAEGTSVESTVREEALSLAGVSHLIVYAGTNDLTGPCTENQLAQAFRSIIGQAGAQGVPAIISTITPRVSYLPPTNEVRAAVNRWIRAGGNCSGECHGVVDFDAVIAWPAYPNAIDPQYDSGDTIHPNAAGYDAMGRSIDLTLFTRPAKPAGAR